MGFFKRLKTAWKMATTEEKIALIVDAVCGVGSASMGLIVGNKISEGRNIAEKICIKTACAGLSLAAGDVASKSLRENYVAPVAALIDRAKEKGAGNGEASADE